jgi:hypothetical protein
VKGVDKLNLHCLSIRHCPDFRGAEIAVVRNTCAQIFNVANISGNSLSREKESPVGLKNNLF